MVKYRFSIAFYKKGWLKTVSFTYNKQDCFDIEKGRNKRKVTGYRKCGLEKYGAFIYGPGVQRSNLGWNKVKRRI